MSKNVIGKDERGFAKFNEFKTTWHGKMRVKESSIAFKGACVWVIADLSYSNTPKEDNPPHFHLSYFDAKNLRDALDRFIAEAEAENLVEPVPEEQPKPGY